ncbi:MAG: secretin N-terminal domain-containing protein [Candidatus Thermoplasmatota archaeon]
MPEETAESRSPPAPEDSPRWHAFADELDLGSLLDLCSGALKIPLEYDRQKIGGRIVLRSGPGLSDEELWALTNRLLFAQGLASVQAPGEETIAVVALEDAAKLARVEEGALDAARAGFVKLIAPLGAVDGGSVEAPLKQILSTSGSLVQVFAEAGQVLLAGPRPQVAEAVRLLALLDTPLSPSVVEEVRPEHLSPPLLVGLLERVTAAMAKSEAGAPEGSVLANPHANTVLIVAPQEEMWRWQSLISLLDHEEAVETRQYVPRRFEVSETARLIEEVVPREAAAGAWRLVEDELTGSLVISAIPSQHAAIEDLMARLEATEPDSRRSLRAFAIKNRDVDEMLALLQNLLGGQELPALAENGSAAEAVPEGGTGEKVATLDDNGLDVTLAQDAGTNRILAIGPPRLLDELGRLVASLDVEHPQVLVEALVVTLTDSQARDLAVSLSKRGGIGSVLGQVSTLFAGEVLPADRSLPAPSGPGFEGILLDPGSFAGVLRALETLNEGRTLTVPKVLVNNHQTATLDSILQTPFLATNASTTVATTSFGGTLDAGTQIRVTPQITSGDRLLIDYSVSLSRFVGDSADPGIPPPRQENKLQSVATVPDGYAVVVGGLEIEAETEATSRVPVLGSLPLVGALFRSRSETKERSRFFVFLRCSVLRNARFEDLRFMSERDLQTAGLADDCPRLEPRVIR